MCQHWAGLFVYIDFRIIMIQPTLFPYFTKSCIINLYTRVSLYLIGVIHLDREQKFTKLKKELSELTKEEIEKVKAYVEILKKQRTH